MIKNLPYSQSAKHRLELVHHSGLRVFVRLRLRIRRTHRSMQLRERLSHLTSLSIPLRHHLLERRRSLTLPCRANASQLRLQRAQLRLNLPLRVLNSLRALSSAPSRAF